MNTLDITSSEIVGKRAIVEKRLGKKLRSLVQTYDDQVERHTAYIEEVHTTLLEIGRCLVQAKRMYASTKEFGEWCVQHGMAQGVFRDAQERSATLKIAELIDDGVAPLGLEEETDGQLVADADRLRLDLTNCRRITPTNILAWARKTQPELFPKLAAKREVEKRTRALKAKQGGERSNLDDDEVLFNHDVNSIGALEALQKKLKERDARIVELEARVAELEAHVAALEAQVAGSRL